MCYNTINNKERRTNEMINHCKMLGIETVGDLEMFKQYEQRPHETTQQALQRYYIAVQLERLTNKAIMIKEIKMGYIRTRMSERAMEAHNNGEKPYSQWNKNELLGYLPSAIFENAKKLTLNELKNELLYNSSWHHTGNCFNRTEFYAINDDAVEELTAERICKIIASRQKKKQKVKEKPLFVTAKIKYTEWEGRFRNYQRPIEYTAIVQYMSNDKLISITPWSKKRLSSVTIIKKIEQKTKFADKKRLEKQGAFYHD